ncbi:MAG: DUF371 domain-containing protein [Acidobacteria bacterium]|nr:DUF371 domain-containing protein [Acidobacteriota bacterium]
MATRPPASALRTIRFRAHGHRNLRATHAKTLEITRDREVSARGTCIVGVGADFEPREVARLRGPIEMKLRVGDLEERVRATATPWMAARDTLIFRRSDEGRGRTFGFGTDKGAADLDRELVVRLRDPDAVLEVEIEELPRSGAERLGVLWVVGRNEAEDPNDELRRVLIAVDSVACAGPMPRWMGDLEPAVDRLPLDAEAQSEAVIEALRDGARVGLLLGAEGTPAGSPVLAVVHAAWELEVGVAPAGVGPSWARVLAASGFAAPPVTWLPAPPRGRGAIREWLARHATGETAVVLLRETQLASVLAAVEALEPDRMLLVARDPGGRNEELLRLPAGEALRDGPHEERGGSRGWVWLVLGPGAAPTRNATPAAVPADIRPSNAAVPDAFLEALLAEGMPVKALARALERVGAGSRREAYQHLLGLQRNTQEGDS